MPDLRDKHLALVIAVLLAFALVAVLIGGSPRSKKHVPTHQGQRTAATDLGRARHVGSLPTSPGLSFSVEGGRRNAASAR